MSTNKTQNYQLHAWGLADELPLGEVNENFAKMDAALKAEETARGTAVAQRALIVTGSYAGNGEESQVINLGFTPKAVLLMARDGRTSYFTGNGYATYGGLALPGKPLCRFNTTIPIMEIVTGGFCVLGTHINSAYCNAVNMTYFYAVLR